MTTTIGWRRCSDRAVKATPLAFTCRAEGYETSRASRAPNTLCLLEQPPIGDVTTDARREKVPHNFVCRYWKIWLVNTFFSAGEFEVRYAELRCTIGKKMSKFPRICDFATH